MTNSPEELRGTENPLVPFLGLTVDVLNSVYARTEDEYSRNLAELVAEELGEIRIGNTEFRRRTVREEDSLNRGEHPGIYARASTYDGSQLNINAYGGIRDPYSDRDLHDVKNFTELQADRTLGLGDKSTQFNLHVRRPTGNYWDVWIVDTPGNPMRRAAVTLTSLIYYESSKQTEHRISGQIAFPRPRIKLPGEYDYYATFHPRLRLFVVSLLPLIAKV